MWLDLISQTSQVSGASSVRSSETFKQDCQPCSEHNTGRIMLNRKTTCTPDWLNEKAEHMYWSFKTQRTSFQPIKNSVVAIFFNLKPYGGSRTLNNQFTSSQKSVWILQEELPANRAKSSSKASKTLRRIKKGIRLCLYEKNSLEHITRGYSGPGNAGGVCSSVPMWYLGAPSILKCLLQNVQ